MRLIPSGLVCLLLINAARAGDAPASVDKVNEAWISHFESYATQKNIGVESIYSTRSGDRSIPSLSGLLRTLPAPDQWAELRRELGEAAVRVPIARKADRQRLEAEGWLLAYLMGDRAAIQTDLDSAIAAEKSEHGQVGFALGYLKKGISGENEMGTSPVKKVEQFEAELSMLEPVDEAAVISALGGAENFARLKRVMAMGREMQARFVQIDAEYEKTKDKAAAEAKAEALQKEYEGKGEADWEALKPYQQNLVVQRYWVSSSHEISKDSPDDSHSPALYVPDLVSVVGRERATALLHRTLQVSARLEVSSEVEEATRQLVREMILAEIGKVKAPSWGLVQAEHAVALFEAFHKKFPQTDTKNYAYRSACGYYLAGLIAQNRLTEAVKFATEFPMGEKSESGLSLPYGATEKLEQTHPDELWQFLRGWLAVKPTVQEWDRFNRLSVQLDRRDELKALVKTMAADGTFNGLDRLTVQRMQADTEMAIGDISAAVQRLQSLIQKPAATPDERSAQMDVIQRLLKLTDLQGDQAGYGALLAAAESLLVAKNKAESGDSELMVAYKLIGTLNGLGHFADSARLGRLGLERVSEIAKNATTKKDSGGDPVSLPDYLFKNLLGEQLWAEVELSHWTEARKLLQENPWWGADDIAGMLNETVSGNTKSMGYYAARIVQQQGDSMLARKILEAQLVATPDVDGVYSAYLSLVGQEALPLLEKLAASDRYQERPLIWKARLQMDAKQWDAAVTTLQQAITIDPSDGEQGRGDRMRVYAFMSETMAAIGDAEKATFFANVVKAIRLSETADRWYEIGAYAKAIELYRQALGFFQDAYCIQSRLALRLADAGRMDEAVEHYRRAFELMPDSFGRVESHCFGCEHAFTGKKPQGVAEVVFTRMLKDRPDKPQLHYLFGYLREEQEHLPEAAEHYRHAVQLDPLYLNAWKRLAGLDEKLKFTPAQRDDLSLQLLELDPGQKHAYPDLEKVTDLPRLWRVLKENGAVLNALPPPDDLWKLPASADRLAQARKEGHESSSRTVGHTPKDFATVMLQHPFVEALQTYLATLNQPAEAEPDDIKLSN